MENAGLLSAETSPASSHQMACRLKRNTGPAPHVPLRDKNEAGAALAVILMVVTLAVVIAFTLAGTGIFHLNVCSREDNSLQARNYAESAVLYAIERVVHANDYGTARNETLEVPSGDTMAGEISFNIEESRKRNIPYSTNNILKNVSIEGSNGRTVSRNSLHLVGVGHCNGVTKRVEAIVHAPPFPFCIACSGEFTSQGKMLVGSVESAAQLEQGIDPEKLAPGHLGSNSTADNAVHLKGEGRIAGDIRTSGDVKFDKGSDFKVMGEIKKHSSPITIPDIDIASYDPRDKPGVQNLNGFVEAPTLEGFCRTEGSLGIAGDLKLNGALLYVGGDLNVAKGVKGKGAIVVKGKTTIGTGAEISSDNLVAMISGGDVKIGSSGASDSSSFQGIIFSRGSFKADNMNLLGAFITKGENASVGRIELSNVNLINIPGYTKIDIEMQTKAKTFRICDSAKYEDAGWNSLWQINSVAGNRYELVRMNQKTGEVMQKKSFARVESDDQDQRPEEPDENIADYFENTFSHNLEMTDMDAYQTYRSLGFCSCGYLNGYLTGFVNPAGASAGGSDTIPIFSLDLSQYLNLEDRMRIILWREI